MKLAVVLIFGFSLAAQEPRFGARSRLVLVPVTVTDQKGNFNDGLDPSDFLLLDDGRPQKAVVDTTATGVAPIALIMAVQSSGISAAVLEKVRKIGVMIHPLVTGEQGCAALVSFAERVQWLQECTKDQDAFARAFQRLQPGAQKQARMLDAVHAAVARLRESPNARRVVLLISESRDRGSESDLETVTAAAQAAGVAVYAATYSSFKTAFTSKSPIAGPEKAKRPSRPTEEMGTMDGNPPSMSNPRLPPPEQRVDIISGIGELARLRKTNTTQVLTSGTGGAALSFARQKGLEDAIEKLAAELHTQYVLSFTPEPSASAGYHRLEVRLVRAGEFRVRARPGYWSTEERQ